MAVESADAVTPVAPDFPARYKIIRGADMMDLARAVNHAMVAGWTPLGGVVHVPVDPLTIASGPGVVQQKHLPYWQALVREATPE